MRVDPDRVRVDPCGGAAEARGIHLYFICIWQLGRGISTLSILEYNPFLLFLLVAGIVPLAAYLLSGAAAPVGGGPEKFLGYESGMEPMADARARFQIRYYMFALIFVIFDVETVFLYPWATSFRGLGIYAFIEAFIFVTILIVGLVYAWRKGALEWS
nr:NADH-plastoquinone oxidoreductase subunit 3 [Selaginella remotifolia]